LYVDLQSTFATSPFSPVFPLCDVTTEYNLTVYCTYLHTSRQFLAEFYAKALGVGLYARYATQPYFNSQSQHGMDHC